MRINNISITSHTALDFEMQPIVIRGEERAKLRIQGVATGIIKKIE